MLEPNPGLVVWTIVTFALLVLILRKFAWRPILESLHKREEYIRSSIERAEQIQQEAERLLEEHRRQIAQAEQEGHRILNESRALGDKLKQEIVDSANQQSRRIVEQAKQEIERDKDAALSELRGEVASLAIQAASKILDEALDEDRHRKIIDSSLKGLPKN